MTDDQAQDVPGSKTGPDSGADSGAKKRPPPTIDLEASEISGDTQAAANSGTSRALWFRLAAVLPPLAGALAALVVVGILWAAGLVAPAQQQASVPPQVESGLNDLSNRIGKVETRLSSTPAAAPDGNLRARVDALETAANILRDQTGALRRQVDATAVALNELKSAPHDGASSPDVSALTERVARLEQTVRTLPDKPQAPAQASDDVRPRRLVIATVLETKVRRGEPYAAALAAAKAVAEDKAALAPLDANAETGVPTEAALAKDLLAQLAQAAPQPAPQSQAEPGNKGTGLLGKLASNLVKVERADTPESVPADAQLQAIAALARQNDVRRAREAVEKLPPDLKARLQPWLDRVSARDAALKTAAAFTSSTLAAMSKTD
jgi:hypothetical protein